MRGFTVTQYDLGEGNPEEALMPWTTVFPSFKDAVLAIRTDIAEFAEDDPAGAKEAFESYDIAPSTDALESEGTRCDSGPHPDLRAWTFTDGYNYLYAVTEAEVAP